MFALLRRLRDEGLAIVYISHRMHEIAELADDCSVFRNGRHVATFAGRHAGPTTQIVEMMIGREYQSMSSRPSPTRSRADRAPALEIARPVLGRPPARHRPAGRPGEIVGLGGLDGQGQRELFLALFGVLRGVSGQIEIDGQPVRIAQPARSQVAPVGMALMPEDRKTEGLMLPMSVRDNLSLAALDRLTRSACRPRRGAAARGRA